MSRLDKRTVFTETMTAWRGEEITPDVFMLNGFGNTTVAVTGDGAVIVDVPAGNSQQMLTTLRAKTDAVIKYIIYTHCHGDHSFTTSEVLEEARKRGHPRPQIIAHENVIHHFNRYNEMNTYNWYINQIQGGRGFAKPTGKEKFLPDNPIYPDITYHDSMSFRLGSLTFELYHYKGESDDGTWVWIPERKVVAAGDLLEGDCPNIGNPFKVQRYDVEWAEALEAIAGKNPDFLVPGHGPLRKGEKVKEWCLDTAKYLRFFHDEIVRLLNEGYWIEDILHMVKPPEELASKRFLSGIYGCPTFMIHGIQRRYAGWYNGEPSELFPSRSADIASEMMKLTDAKDVLKRAEQLKQEGNPQLALHLVDFVIKGSKYRVQRKKALLVKSQLLDARAGTETNQIARNILLVGAEEAEQMARDL